MEPTACTRCNGHQVYKEGDTGDLVCLTCGNRKVNIRDNDIWADMLRNADLRMALEQGTQLKLIS